MRCPAAYLRPTSIPTPDPAVVTQRIQLQYKRQVHAGARTKLDYLLDTACDEESIIAHIALAA